MSSQHAVVAAGWDFEYETTYSEIQYLQCQACDLIFPRELPVVEALPTIYPGNYYAFSETEHENPTVRRARNWMGRRKMRTYAELLPSGPTQVLEIGCGDGRMLDILRRSSPSDWAFSGLDWSDDAAARCRAKGYDARAANVEQLDEPDWKEKFDLILMSQVIEHVRYPRNVLERIWCILKPGGVISIETPDINAWDFRVFHNRYWAGYHIPRHFFIFSKANFSELAAGVGYEIVSTTSIINPVAWIHSVKSYCADHRQLRRFARTFHAQNPLWLSIATPIDLVQTMVFHRSSNMQIVLRRPGDVR